MKTKIFITAALISLLALVLYHPKSELKLKQLAKEEKVAVTPETTVTGTPDKVIYSVKHNSWKLALDVKSNEGTVYNVNIDSLTAMSIIQGKIIFTVKITEKYITFPGCKLPSFKYEVAQIPKI